MKYVLVMFFYSFIPFIKLNTFEFTSSIFLGTHILANGFDIITINSFTISIAPYYINDKWIKTSL